MPSSWCQARLNAQARFPQGNAQAKGGSLYQMLHDALQASALERIWREIEQRLEEPEYAEYQGAYLFFSSKNTKSIYKGATLAQAWETFNTQLTHVFDPQFLDEDLVWLGLGKKTICRE
ncbi:hypothetical protein ACMFMG_008124 [Clarireedia jacksonii]